MIALLLAAAAWAGECEPLQPLDRSSLSVAWVAPASRRVFAGTWLTVVPTQALRTWARTHDATTARMLQGLGRRRSWRPPSRTWLVTVFEVPPDRMCRPLDLEEVPEVAGIQVCERGDRGVEGRHQGCGYTLDLAHGRRGLDVFRIRWKDAAARGFCVLPADRFLAGE